MLPYSSPRVALPACLLGLGVAFAVTGCQNPTRPGEAQAMVEVQIRDTRNVGDDHVPTGTSVPARARITNDLSFDSPVAVTLKNARPGFGGQVRFGSGASNVITLSLPDDGSWTSFTVQGTAGQTSQRDRDAIIEVAEDRPDGIVLARKALDVVATAPTAPPPGVAVDVSQTRTSVDDYLTWSPTRVDLSLTGASGTGTLGVTVRNMTPVTGGRLAFAPLSAINASGPQSTAGTATLNVSLPRDGSPVTIWVAGDCRISTPAPSGTCTGASQRDKDAVLEVVETSSGRVLGRKGLMVRIRKDAETLTDHERDRFLDAVAKLNNTLDNYQIYQEYHRAATAYAHNAAGFLPWHRTFVLQLERELQALAPAVALPYWKFDESASAVFDSAFMGAITGGTNPGFEPGNPLSNWSVTTTGGNTSTAISRNPDFDAGQAPSGLRDESTTLSLGDPPSGSSGPSTFADFRDMENDPHDEAHVEGGGSGWLTSTSTAVLDPIFFMVHSNVDRLWAKWQFMDDHYDPTSSNSYAPQGSYSGSAPALGNRSEDSMWPWDEDTGGDRFLLNPPSGSDFPQTIGRTLSPPLEPSPADVVPYDANDVQPSGLGFGYDDVPFRP